MKAMISQPMNGLTDEQIEAVRNKAITELQNGGYEVVDTFFKEGFKTGYIPSNKPVYYLAKSLEMMSHVMLFTSVKDGNTLEVVKRSTRLPLRMVYQYYMKDSR